MRRLSLQSVNGGVGRTTLLANLAQAFVRAGRQVLAIDFDPQGQLALHLGLDPDLADGLLPRWRARQEWAHAGVEVGGIRLLPFGLADAAALRDFERQLLQQPDWLACQLDRLTLPDDPLILIDAPSLPSLFARQAAHAASLNIGVLRPDVLAPLAVARLDDWLNDDVTGAPPALLVNGVDPTRDLPTAVLDLLRDQHADRLSPHIVHLDHALSEALAADASVFDYAPHSLAAHDLHGLSGWLLARLDAMAELTHTVSRR
jgi:cellulose synthase operon protein YhjQ